MISVVVVAGGKGVRLGGPVRKQYIAIKGQPVLGWTLKAVVESGVADEVIAVVPTEDVRFCRKTVLEPLELEFLVKLVPGGDERQQSVYEGLRACCPQTRIAAIHDGVRPFVNRKILKACIEGAEQWGGAIAAVPAVDTLKVVGPDGRVRSTFDRRLVRLAQTPQAFRFPLILEAHEKAAADGFMATDDSQLVERIGGEVKVVEGSSRNIKITRPADLVLAEIILESR
ncbi:MAG: 2-C-methyl-D-erythritol 4-phosphate cytidylyltransferase [Desulfobacterales bacterium]